VSDKLANGEKTVGFQAHLESGDVSLERAYGVQFELLLRFTQLEALAE